LKADLVINTTPVGMAAINSKNSEPIELIPLGQEIWQNLKPSTTLYDLIYTPRPTNWLSWGAKHGCRCIDGLEMLVQQGAASLRLWSGKNDVPIEEMRKAALSHLAT
ncbi:MAG: shikimate dehydrogenase, partial [Prochlorococcus sp.]